MKNIWAKGWVSKKNSLIRLRPIFSAGVTSNSNFKPSQMYGLNFELVLTPAELIGRYTILLNPERFRIVLLELKLKRWTLSSYFNLPIKPINVWSMVSKIFNFHHFMSNFTYLARGKKLLQPHWFACLCESIQQFILFNILCSCCRM